MKASRQWRKTYRTFKGVKRHTGYEWRCGEVLLWAGMSGSWHAFSGDETSIASGQSCSVRGAMIAAATAWREHLAESMESAERALHKANGLVVPVSKGGDV